MPQKLIPIQPGAPSLLTPRQPLPTEPVYAPGIQGVAQRVFEQGMHGLLGAAGMEDPLSPTASPAAGIGAIAGMLVPIGMAAKTGSRLVSRAAPAAERLLSNEPTLAHAAASELAPIHVPKTVPDGITLVGRGDPVPMNRDVRKLVEAFGRDKVDELLAQGDFYLDEDGALKRTVSDRFNTNGRTPKDAPASFRALADWINGSSPAQFDQAYRPVLGQFQAFVAPKPALTKIVK